MGIHCNGFFYFYVCLKLFIIIFFKGGKGAPRPGIGFLPIMGEEGESPGFFAHILSTTLPLRSTLHLAHLGQPVWTASTGPQATYAACRVDQQKPHQRVEERDESDVKEFIPPAPTTQPHHGLTVFFNKGHCPSQEMLLQGMTFCPSKFEQLFLP